MFLLSWVLLIAAGLLISLGVFFWSLRTGQFSDQERARYLPLAGEVSPPPLPNPAKISTEVYALLFAVGFGLLAMIAAVVLTLIKVKA